MNNNKLIKIMLLIMVIVFIIISCNKKSAPKNIEADEVIIDVSYVDESFLKKYDAYDSFVRDDDLVRIAFTSNVPVKDFSWLSISINFDDRDEIVHGIDKVLYSIKELHPEKPLVVSWTEVGIMSCFGFSYRDKNGQKKYFIGFVGNYGADPEEYDGPAFVVGQFFPMEIVTGQYQYTDDETTLILDLREASYTLKINGVVYTGTAVIDFGDIGADIDSWYVTLGGIKWAHNWIENFSQGIPNMEPDKWADKETYGVELWFKEGEEGNELFFQNRGNPMAPYVIFGEVTEKFVILTKVSDLFSDQPIYDDNLCANNEEILLSFKMINSSNTLSLCVSKSWSAPDYTVNNDGVEDKLESAPDYIVYRYGTKDNIELEFPNDKIGSWNKFTLEHRTPLLESSFAPDDRRGEMNWIVFTNNGYQYLIYEYFMDKNDIGITIINQTTDEKIDLKGLWSSRIGSIESDNWYGNTE